MIYNEIVGSFDTCRPSVLILWHLVWNQLKRCYTHYHLCSCASLTAEASKNTLDVKCKQLRRAYKQYKAAV